jgi:hypothetical protein
MFLTVRGAIEVVQEVRNIFEFWKRWIVGFKSAMDLRSRSRSESQRTRPICENRLLLSVRKLAQPSKVIIELLHIPRADATLPAASSCWRSHIQVLSIVTIW